MAIIKIIQHDDIYIDEIHLTKKILESYGMNVEIIKKDRPFGYKTMFDLNCKNKTISSIAVSLLSSLCHCKTELKRQKS